MSSSPNRRAWEWDWQATTGYSADAYRYNARLGFQDDTNDVGVSHLLSPVGMADSGSVVVPACSVANYGLMPTSAFDVRMRIGTFYDETAPVPVLAPGEKEYVEFSTVVLDQPLGTYVVSCSTEYSLDENDPRLAVVEDEGDARDHDQEVHDQHEHRPADAGTRENAQPGAGRRMRGESSCRSDGVVRAWG